MTPSSTNTFPTPRRGIGSHRVAGVVHDAVQQAVMQYGYDDELYQAWRDGEIGEKDLPEEVMASYDFGPLREVASGARAV